MFPAPLIDSIAVEDGAVVTVHRGRDMRDYIHIGPDKVHFMVIRKGGQIEDLGISDNLLTNIGRDAWADNFGGKIPAGGAGSPATATSATSITATSTPWTASNFGTPQLGITGLRVYASVTGITTAPVYGNIGSNTSSVATIDKWWTAADGTGTTPASTNAFIIGAGGAPSVRFIGLTTDSGAASASDTVLASEITTGGCSRALGTYAHTYGQSTYTLANTFSVSSSFTAIHKAGAFTCSTSTAGGVLVFETVLNQDATVGNGDSLTVTWTWTLSG